jgi:hypothetical protein
MTAINRTKQKRVALNLFLNGQFTQKEISQIVRVSEKTIGKWVKVYGWNKLNTGVLSLKGDEHIISRFLKYTETENPELYKSLNNEFRQFIISNKLNFNI